MTEERFKLIDKVRNELFYFKEDRKKIADSTHIRIPISNIVQKYILGCLDMQITELQKEFDSL
jgi:hypothetical protein